MENPPKKYYRLSPGSEVRLRYSYLIKCEEAIKDEQGNVIELKCTYDPQSGGGSSSDGRRVKGVIHWVSAPHAQKAEIRLYSNLFAKENPNDVEEGKTFLDYLNPDSMKIIEGFIEPSLQDAAPGSKFQFERTGYFCADPDSTPGHMVFNRTGLDNQAFRQRPAKIPYGFCRAYFQGMRCKLSEGMKSNQTGFRPPRTIINISDHEKTFPFMYHRIITDSACNAGNIICSKRTTHYSTARYNHNHIKIH